MIKKRGLIKIIFILLIGIFLVSVVSAWQFEVTTTAPNQEFRFHADNANLVVNWGDGTSDGNFGPAFHGLMSHVYASAGSHRVTVTGTSSKISFCGDGNFIEGCGGTPVLLTDILTPMNDGLSGINSAWQMFREATSITSFSRADWFDATSSGVTSMSQMFYKATNFNQDISGWDVSNVRYMYYMFSEAQAFNQPLNNWNVGSVTQMAQMFYGADIFNQPLNNWDVSSVTRMNYMFAGADVFNQPLNNWDVSSVTDMQSMFYGAQAFNQPLNNWNVGSVKDMEWMFARTPFNQDISNWNTGNVIEMNNMFYDAQAFNQPLNNWNVGSVTDMHGMFWGADSFAQSLSNWNTVSVTNMGYMFMQNPNFNQPIGNWDTSSVTNFMWMFRNAGAFNQDISNWDTSSVINMYGMFWGANSFNQPLSNWNTASVTDMDWMFFYAGSFDQPLNNWITSSVTDMHYMFYGATSFDQDLGSWDVSSVMLMDYMFSGVTLSTANYDSLLIGWNNRALQPNVFFHGGNSQYCTGEVARANMISSDGWTITDDGKNCPPICSNNIKETGEVCDGSDLDGESCLSRLGSDWSGSLGCLGDCSDFNVGSCVCNDARTDADVCVDQCAGTAVDNCGVLRTCNSSACEGLQSCVAGSCVDPGCNNGAKDAGEDCDSGNLYGGSCFDEGFTGGTLGCSGVCVYDVSNCYNLEWTNSAYLIKLITDSGSRLNILLDNDAAYLRSTGNTGLPDGSVQIDVYENDGLGDDLVATLSGVVSSGVISASWNPVLQSEINTVLGIGDEDYFDLDEFYFEVAGISGQSNDLWMSFTLPFFCGDDVLTPNGADGVVGGGDDEECDGAEFGGSSCVTEMGVGYSGSLACTGGCAIDTGGCIRLPYWADMNGNEIDHADFGDTVYMIAPGMSSGTFEIKENDFFGDDDIRSVSGEAVGFDWIGSWTIEQADMDETSDYDEFYFEVNGIESGYLNIYEEAVDDPMEITLVSPDCGNYYNDGDDVEIVVAADDDDDVITGTISINGEQVAEFSNGGISFIEALDTPGTVQIVVEASNTRGEHKRVISNIMVLEVASGIYIDGEYIAACITKPEDFSNIDGSKVEFDASATLGVRVVEGVVNLLVPGEHAFSWYWMFYPEEIARNFVNSIDPLAYKFTAEFPVAGDNSASLRVEV